jgi:hypothetical protein
VDLTQIHIVRYALERLFGADVVRRRDMRLAIEKLKVKA